MRKSISAFVGFTCVLSAWTWGAETDGVRHALTLLPKDAAARLAMIEGREGAPNPQRWYLIVQDDQAENGLREYVVSGGALVAVREFSQFTEHLSRGQIVGTEGISLDSDELALLAREQANDTGARSASFNFELEKDRQTGRPLWNVECLDASGARLATVMIDGQSGSVLSRGLVSVRTSAAPRVAAQATPPEPIATPPTESTDQLLREFGIVTGDPVTAEPVPDDSSDNAPSRRFDNRDPDTGAFPNDRSRQAQKRHEYREDYPPPVRTIRRIIRGFLPF